MLNRPSTPRRFDGPTLETRTGGVGRCDRRRHADDPARFLAVRCLVAAGGAARRHARPVARRDGTTRRFDFAFPQRAAALPGWAGWRPRLWDYLFLGFSGSTQFGLSDTAAI
jgi:hypothetical protein